ELMHRQMDAGAGWMLVDLGGQPVRIWDERGHVTRVEYDATRRPTHRWVTAPDRPEYLAARTVYGEGRPDLNLSGLVFRHYDAAGVSVNERSDFNGTLVDRPRTLARDYRTDPDWAPTAPPSGAAALAAATARPPGPARFQLR